MTGDTLDKAAVALGNTVASAGLVWVAFLFAWRLTGSVAGAARTALALGFGTLVWPYSKFGFNAPLTAWCLLAGVYAAWVGARTGRLTLVAWSGVWLACAFLTRHEAALTVPIVAIWIASALHDDRPRVIRALVSFGAPLAIAAAFWLWYNDVRFGNPFNSGYLGDPTIQFGTPFAGLYGLLFSPGRSIFVYAPLTLAGLAAMPSLARRDFPTAVLFAGLTIVLLLFYGTLSSWDGGRSYGPRYLVPLLPFLVLPMAWWLTPGGRRSRRALALVVAAIVTQIPGVLVDFSKVSIAYGKAGGHVAESRLYAWNESGIVLNTRAALDAVPANLGYLARGERPVDVAFPSDDDSREPGAWRPPPPKTESALNRQLGFSLDFWWLYLFYLGAVPAPVAAAVPVVLIGAGALAFWKAFGRPAEDFA